MGSKVCPVFTPGLGARLAFGPVFLLPYFQYGVDLHRATDVALPEWSLSIGGAWGAHR